jgi:osmotically-inducible protein OsmY
VSVGRGPNGAVRRGQETLEPGSISVTVRRGVVGLEGEVERRSLIEILVGLVRGVDGVVALGNHLTFWFDDTEGRSPSQSATTLAARAALAPVNRQPTRRPA